MRVHVALSPSEFADAPVSGRTVLAVDVLRATSAAVAACEAGCRRVVPVPDEAAAEALRDGAGVVLAGERGGHPIPGFDLGNSPDEFTRARVEGRTVVLTTTNGTAAMMRATTGAAAGLAALTNVTAAARWALEQGRDVTILCAGDNGAFSLEDAVCAGLLVARLSDGMPAAELSGGAEAARRGTKPPATNTGTIRLTSVRRHQARSAARPSRWSLRPQPESSARRSRRAS